MISLICLKKGDLFLDDFNHLCTVDLIDRKRGICHYYYTCNGGFCVYRSTSFTTIVKEISDLYSQQLTLF